MKHIFISFSQRDRKHMTTMRDNLIRIGYRPWIDRNPRPGLDWRFEIDDAIRAADAVIVIVSPVAAESTYVTYEWSLALGMGIPVIPVVFTKAKMHPRLQTLEHFDFTGFTAEVHFWEYFTREIQRILDTEPVPQQNISVPAPNPAPAQPVVAEPSAPIASFTRQVMPKESGHHLVVRRGPLLNKMFKLDKEVITLGRDATNDITIDDPEVSRYHLRFKWNGTVYTVEDLGSTNGTRINGGQRISMETALQSGQALMLGDTIILSYEVIR